MKSFGKGWNESKSKSCKTNYAVEVQAAIFFYKEFLSQKNFHNKKEGLLCGTNHEASKKAI